MSYSLDPGDVILATRSAQYLGQTVLNMMFYHNVSTTSAVAGEVVLDELANEFVTNTGTWPYIIGQKTVVAMTWLEMWCQKVYPTRWRKSVKTVAQPGAIDDTGIHVNQAMSIQKVVEAAARGSQGKMQITGVPANYLQAGMISGVGLAAGQTIANSLPLPIVLVGNVYKFEPITFGYVDLPPGVTKHRVVAGRVQPTARVMRRRTVGVGK